MFFARSFLKPGVHVVFARIRVWTFKSDEHCEGVDGGGIAAKNRAVEHRWSFVVHTTSNVLHPRKCPQFFFTCLSTIS